MQMTRKYTGFVSANWDQAEPEYTMMLSGNGPEQVRLMFSKTGPYTIDGVKFALGMWQTTKLLHWAIAVVYILTIVPWAVGKAAADGHSPIDFDTAVKLLPDELVAEVILEGVVI